MSEPQPQMRVVNGDREPPALPLVTREEYQRLEARVDALEHSKTALYASIWTVGYIVGLVTVLLGLALQFIK